MMDAGDYFLRRVEECGRESRQSFSSGYMHGRRFEDIENAFLRELRKPGARGAARVLEVGCGDGWLIYRLLARYGKDFRLDFTGVDLSEFDIEFARRRKERFGVPGCDFRLMDAARLEFDDESFDIIITSELLEHLPDPRAALSGMCRVLKKGGLVIATTPNGGENLFLKAVRLADRVAFGALRRTFHGRPAAQAPFFLASSSAGPGGDIRYDHISEKSAREWRRVFADAGFHVETLRGTGGMVYGCADWDRHPVVFAGIVIVDTLLKRAPFSYRWSELLFAELRKHG